MFKSELEKAKRHQLKAIELLEKSEQFKNLSLLQCYKIMSSIYNQMGDSDKAKLYLDKLTKNN